MNNKAILLAAIALLATSSFLMIGGTGVQTADASGPNCPSKGGAANAPNAVNTKASPVAVQPTV